jgi:hypothetical protein
VVKLYSTWYMKMGKNKTTIDKFVHVMIILHYIFLFVTIIDGKPFFYHFQISLFTLYTIFLFCYSYIILFFLFLLQRVLDVFKILIVHKTCALLLLNRGVFMGGVYQSFFFGYMVCTRVNPRVMQWIISWIVI